MSRVSRCVPRSPSSKPATISRKARFYIPLNRVNTPADGRVALSTHYLHDHLDGTEAGASKRWGSPLSAFKSLLPKLSY
jgi:hypothetical protein